jgi:hypothetical protein
VAQQQRSRQDLARDAASGFEPSLVAELEVDAAVDA